MANKDALNTIKRDSLIGQPLVQTKQDVAADQEETAFKEQCPQDMYTHPASEKNFKYNEGTQS